MIDGERKILACGVAAGTIIGLALGLMIAFIAVKPELFAGRNIASGVSFVVGLGVAFILILVAMRTKAS